MKRFFAVALGILTAIGGLRRHRRPGHQRAGRRPVRALSLAWVVVVGVIGICVFAEMSGRVAAVSGRATFDLVRERLGPRVGLLNLVGSMARHLPDLHRRDRRRRAGPAAGHLGPLPAVGPVRRRSPSGWCCGARKFSAMENVLGLLGLALIVFARRALAAGARLGRPGPPGRHGRQAGRASRGPTYVLLRGRPVRRGDDAVRGVLLLLRRRRGAVDGQGPRDHAGQRVHRASRSAACCRWPSPALRPWCCSPTGIAVDTLGQVGAAGGGGAGQGRRWRSRSSGFFAATFGAACETGLSVGYSIAQYFGWQWGKYVRPEAARLPHRAAAGRRSPAVGVLLTDGRPDHGHGVLGRVLRGRAAADLLPDPGRRQRPGLHGRARQRAARQRARQVYLVRHRASRPWPPSR